VGDVRRFDQLGGHVALDFVNTLGGLPDDPDDEYLHQYDDLLIWTERVGRLTPASAVQLREAAVDDPPGAQVRLTRARQLRNSLDRVLRAQLSDDPHPDAGDLAVLRGAYLAAIEHATFEPADSGMRWSWRDDGDLDRPLWPIAVAAIELLQTGPLQLLARCGHCRWLFLDTSRQHNRRWCSMNACGAIVKMRRYRASRRL
jgi:predicted RNA-binding Zn ribbon-like protein